MHWYSLITQCVGWRKDLSNNTCTTARERSLASSTANTQLSGQNANRLIHPDKKCNTSSSIASNPQATLNPTAIESAQHLLLNWKLLDLIPDDVVIGTFNRDTKEVGFKRLLSRSEGMIKYEGKVYLRNQTLRVYGPVPLSAYGYIIVMFHHTDSKVWRVLVEIPYNEARCRIPLLPEPCELSEVDNRWSFIGYTANTRSPSESQPQQQNDISVLDKRNSVGSGSTVKLPSEEPE